MDFVRYCALEPNARGVRPGVFALANGLANAGRLSAAEHSWWRESNDWYTAAYPLPPAHVYDRETNPGAVSWFKAGTSAHLIDRLDGYLRLLDRYGVAWQRLASDVPGRVVYEDDVQVVACPE